MRLVLDMDEVLAQWVARILQYYNEDHKTQFTLKDVSNWNVVTNFGPGSEDAIRSYMRYPELYRDLEPVEGAVEGVRKLLADGHDVVVATAVPKCAGISYHGKLEWLRRNMPFFPLNSFVSIHRKDLLAFSADLLLDDGIHNLEPWSKTGRWAVAFDRPWNRDWTGPRVMDWDHFLKLVDAIGRQLGRPCEGEG